SEFWLLAQAYLDHMEFSSPPANAIEDHHDEMSMSRLNHFIKKFSDSRKSKFGPSNGDAGLWDISCSVPRRTAKSVNSRQFSPASGFRNAVPRHFPGTLPAYRRRENDGNVLSLCPQSSSRQPPNPISACPNASHFRRSVKKFVPAIDANELPIGALI